MLYPFLFEPRFKERVWGGRNLESLFGKALPPAKVIGESWEISDRPGDESVIANGPLAGRTLHWLVQNHSESLFGASAGQRERFPLLVKILDAQDTLSLQVHPPAKIAPLLGGEPKTEMWFIVGATPDAALYAGLKPGITRQEFERRLRGGTVADCFHRIPVRQGDALFVPSGRVHAIGAGSVLFEVQQNSDTTYRAFDWNRLGLDGNPRELHVAEALQSIDFEDFEPPLIQAPAEVVESGIVRRMLVDDPLFRVQSVELGHGKRWKLDPGVFHIIGVVSGELRIGSTDSAVTVGAGKFCLVPAAFAASAAVSGEAHFLDTQPGEC